MPWLSRRSIRPAPELVLLALLSASCGYTVTTSAGGGIRRLAVAPIEEPGLDIDGGAMVSVAVRRAVARGPGLRLVRTHPDALLFVRLIDARTGLRPLADPGARAAQYAVTVKIQGELRRADGAALWTSPTIVGAAEMLSPADGVEAIDGARRRTLQRAAEDAAEQLVVLIRHREPTSSGSR